MKKDKNVKLYLGDNMDSLKKIPDNSIDSVVTDPPYGLSFMAKKWDHDVPTIDFWKEVYRVLKPGGHVLSFGGTRTYHRMVVNIEDAGFEIRDQIQWIYSTGFPKSHNIGKAVSKMYGRIGLSCDEVKIKMKELYDRSNKSYSQISKECGFNASGYIKITSDKPDPWTKTLPTQEKWFVIADVIGCGEVEKNEISDLLKKAEMEVVGKKTSGLFNGGESSSVGGNVSAQVDITKSTIKEGQDWDGWGTSIKPSNEPICIARKPLSEKSVAENVLKWSTGGINIDGCRIEGAYGSGKNEVIEGKQSGVICHNYDGETKPATGHKNKIMVSNPEGRFPANIIFQCICDDVIKGEKGKVTKCFPGGSTFGGSKMSDKVEGTWYNDKGDIHTDPMCPCYMLDEQSPGASRFFYQAKVSKLERNMGLDEFEDKVIEGRDPEQDERSVAYKKIPTPTKNTHVTVKPVNLMAYLCRLITPPGGICLDPFMGSGSTGIAARLEGFRFVGMEMDRDYFNIAQKRIEEYEQYTKFVKK